ncbi:MAG: slipin family protein [Planctomycetes bacterium]|nr:slipin family protein [Planctomycetota bacterium]
MFNRKFKIKQHERGVMFRDGDFVRLLPPGEHKFFDPLRRVKVEIANLREPWFTHAALDVIAASHALNGLAEVLDVQAHQRAFVWIDGKFAKTLGPGRYAIWKVLHQVNVAVADMRTPLFSMPALRELANEPLLTQSATLVDLKDNQRALVWVDGRFERILKPGLHALFKAYHEIRTEVLTVEKARFEHPELLTMLQSSGVADALSHFPVEPGFVGLLYEAGKFTQRLESGNYAFWTGVSKLKLFTVDMREQAVDVQGQEIMTADKVTLRLNALVTYRVVDALKAVSETDDAKQAIYREAQLALRESVGTQELDALLANKDALAASVGEKLVSTALRYGIEVVRFGVRDIILPGDMKDILNKVTQAKKAAEAGLITRREETASMRMQANTAKILENNPTLMRLRELEIVEKVAEKANLTVVLGEGNLKDRVIKMM